MGPTPPTDPPDDSWHLDDVIHVAPNLWALLKSGRTEPDRKTVVVAPWGRWKNPTLVGRYESGDFDNPRPTLDGQYHWSTPILRSGEPPYPESRNSWQFTPPPDMPASVETVYMPVSWSDDIRFGRGPSLIGERAAWFAQDGRPDRWAKVGWGVEYAYATMASDVGRLTPQGVVVFLNDRAYPISGMPGWRVDASPPALHPAWFKDADGEWGPATHPAQAATPHYKSHAHSVGVGTAFLVALAWGEDNAGRRVSHVGWVERSTGRSRWAKREGETVAAGPVVNGSKAIYYVDADAVGDPDRSITKRIVVDLATGRFSEEEQPYTNVRGIDAPAYMTDVPRTALDDNRERVLLMDGDVLPIPPEYDGVGVVGTVILVHVGLINSRSLTPWVNQARAVQWAPDSTLGDGAHRSKGDFV